jgi:hypothetical protein
MICNEGKYTFKTKIEASPHRKYQSVIYWKKLRGAKFYFFVCHLKRKHLDFVDDVMIFGFDLVNQHAHHTGLQTAAIIYFFLIHIYLFNS